VSRYKFDRSHEFIPGYKVGGWHWRSVAVQFVSEQEICHDAGFKLRAHARVRVQEPLQNYHGSRSKSKNRDKQLTHIVRVSNRVLIIIHQLFYIFIYTDLLGILKYYFRLFKTYSSFKHSVGLIFAVIIA